MTFRLTFLLLPLFVCTESASAESQEHLRPNILLAISDDQSYPHASAYGCRGASTPAFDRIAKRGVLFTNAFCPSPGCSPSRASLLTGRYPWQNRQAGTHASSFPADLAVYPQLLEQAGYFVGATGKGWGPGNFKIDGRSENPAGKSWLARKLQDRSASGISNNDYAGNFQDFFTAYLKQRENGQPFCFWYGATEPHRGFEKGSGLKAGKKLADADVPSFLPDTPEVRSDILDYYLEIEHFDAHLGAMLKILEEAGELENTLVVATSDNGMAFPRAKANCYEYGIHAPLAICWPARVPAGRQVDDLVSFVDFAPTFLEAAGLPRHEQFAGKSLVSLLASEKEGVVEPERKAVYSARERHSSSRFNNWTYPQRALRTAAFLLIHNFRPDRWPAGDPQKLDENGKPGPLHGGYHDIDACPTLSFLIERREDEAIGPFFHLAVDKRPEWELFDIRRDAGCLNNLAESPDHAKVLNELQTSLASYLRETKDPRQLDGGEIFETYRRYSPTRKFPPPQEGR